MKIFQFPLARITIWFVPGIALAYYAQPDLKTAAILQLSAFFIFVFAWLFAKQHLWQKLLFGCSLYVLSFFVGMSTQIIHVDYLRESNYIYFIQRGKVPLLEITIREKLKGNTFSDRYIGIVNHIDNQRATGKILVNVRKNKTCRPFPVGSRVFIKSPIIRHKPPLNPDQFDYGKYLLNKSIPAQLYADADAIKCSRAGEKDIWYYSDAFRNKMISNLQKSGFHAEELHVVNALILGQQQDISAAILQDYQFAGAVHILSVSGLHVGFILLFLNFILKPLPNNGSGRALKLAIILSFLWGFAVVSGFSPSVIRSATMFSFVAWGMYLKRSTNIFHTLLVSLLLILLFEPAFLFDVGFQLSYTALFFILWLQPVLSGIWLPKNKIIKYFWDILTVSFAAQIGAFPLSIYYFHQFPGLFFVTNLIVIPLLSIIMVLGVLVMLMAAFGFVPLLFAGILEWSIRLMNTIISKIASFENFIIQDIPFNFWMLVTAYLLIISIVVWFKKPGFQKMALICISVILFQATLCLTKWNVDNTSELIVFQVKKSTVVAERNGRNVCLYSKINPSQSSQSRMLKTYLSANFSTIDKTRALQNTLFFNHCKILVLDSVSIYPKTCDTDVLMLTQSPKINLERLLQNHHPEVIVADATNFKTYAARWRQTCAKQKIPFHYTNEKGFFRLKKAN